MQKPLRTTISLTHIFKTALFTVLGMISYFFLMKLLNMNVILELRYLNILFIFFGVRHVLMHKQTMDGNKVQFHSAMMIGFLTSFLIAAMFSVFTFSYLSVDTTFMSMVTFSQPFGRYLTPASATIVTFLECVACGSVVSIPVLWSMKKRSAISIGQEVVG